MAIRDLTARIRITADTRGVTKGLKSAERSVDSFSNKALKSVALLGGGFFAARKAIDEFTEAANRAGQKVALQAQLDATNESLDDFLVKLDEVALGTISTANLIQQSSNALLLGIPADAIVTLLEQARVAAIATGQSVSKAFADITLGVARQSRLILDNLGIIIRVDDANQKYADQLGVNVKALDQNQRQQAFLNEVLAIGKDRVETFGDAAGQAALKLDRLKAAAANAVDRIADLAVATSETNFFVGDFIDSVTDLGQLISGQETLTQQFIDRFEKIGVALGADVKQADLLADAIANLGDTGTVSLDLLTGSSDASVASLLRLIFNLDELLRLFGLLPEQVDRSTDSFAKYRDRVDELIAQGVNSADAIFRVRLEIEGENRARRIAAEEVENQTNKVEDNTEAIVENKDATVAAADSTERLGENARFTAAQFDLEREAARRLKEELIGLNDQGVITATTFDRIAQTQGIQAAVDAALQSGATTFGRRINLRGGSRLVPVSVLNNRSGVAFVGGGFGGSQLFQPTTIGEFLGSD